MAHTPPLQPTRRSFLGHGALGLGALYLGPIGLHRRRGPLDVGVIGLGRAGTVRLRELLAMPGCRVRSVCDVDEQKQEAARVQVDKAYGNKECNTYADYRDLLRGEELDAVVVATPDHWHALIVVAAFRAGLDVYCEAPLTLTVDEGREIAAAAQLTGRILQVGMSWRTNRDVVRLCELIRAGRFGSIRRIRGEMQPGRTLPQPDQKPRSTRVPDGFRYDSWLGPAPLAPYHVDRCRGFRWLRDYAGGRITEQGLTVVDIAQWALGRDDSGPTQIRGRATYPATGLFDNVVRADVEFRYADGLGLDLRTTDRHRITFEGTRGAVSFEPLSGRVECDPGTAWDRPLPSSARRLPRAASLLEDFVDSVLTRRQPIGDLAVGRRSADICHLANIALRLEREVVWDPGTGAVVDAQVRRMLRRPRRPKWGMKM